jgi:DNA N-6-adenine-methyltransferase Dam
MVDNYEKAKGESSEWRTPKFIFDGLGLRFALDPCAPEGGFYCVPAEKIYTARDDGLVKPWGDGLAYVNPPWSEHRGAVVPWLRRFFAHPGGGILVCVARTSCSWFHEIVLPQAELLCFPTGKTRFIKPDGSPGPSPTNGIALIGVGAAACDALRRSGLGFCLTVDRDAATPTRVATLLAVAAE